MIGRRAILTVALTASGCVRAFDPQIGAQVAKQCDDADSDPATPVSYAGDVAPLLGEYCTVCHTPAGATPIGVDESGLDMSTYVTLRTGGGSSGENIVVPGHPCSSVLAQKVSTAPPFGARMPLGGPYMADDEIQTLHDWIAEGAHDN
jgi:hypothetical protein